MFNFLLFMYVRIPRDSRQHRKYSIIGELTKYFRCVHNMNNVIITIINNDNYIMVINIITVIVLGFLPLV